MPSDTFTATTSARHARPQREEPTVDATGDADGLPQRKEAPVPTADLNARGRPRAEIPHGVTGHPSNQHASTPAIALRTWQHAKAASPPDTGQPTTGNLGTDAGHQACRRPPPDHPPIGHGAQGTAATQAHRVTQRPERH